MTITDGGIMFVACVLSFAIGYVIGAVRVTRYVNKRLDSVLTSMAHVEEHSREVRQIYSRLNEPDDPSKPRHTLD